MPANLAPVDLIWIGVAKETTPGTAVAPTLWIPTTTMKPKEVITPLKDTASRGAMSKTYDSVQGVKSTTFDLAGPAFPSSFPWVMAAILGDVATTGASAPFTHTMGVNNANASRGQPKSYTIIEFVPEINSYRQYAGCKLSEAHVNITADGAITWTARALGFPSATAVGPFTATWGGDSFDAGWLVVATVGGTATPQMQSATIDLVREKPEAVHGLTGTQAPYAIWVGDLGATGKLEFIAEDETQFLNHVNNTQPSLDLNAQIGAGAGLTQLKWHATKAAYEDGEKERGSSYTRFTTSYEALGNTTDVGASAGYSPIKFTAQDAQPSGTFA